MGSSFFYYKVSYYSGSDNSIKEDEGITFVESGKYCDAVAKIVDCYGEGFIETLYIQYIDSDITCITLAGFKNLLERLNSTKEENQNA
jgi:hypothetical protein